MFNFLSGLTLFQGKSTYEFFIFWSKDCGIRDFIFPERGKSLEKKAIFLCPFSHWIIKLGGLKAEGLKADGSKADGLKVNISRILLLPETHTTWIFSRHKAPFLNNNWSPVILNSHECIQVIYNVMFKRT